MFNIGGGELLVIALIALIVLGPERLPGAARQIGKTLGELRRLSSGFQAELRDALDAEPTDAPASSRGALGAGAGTASADGSVSAAVRAVSGEPGGNGADVGERPARPPRRTPLVAGPAKKGPAKSPRRTTR